MPPFQELEPLPYHREVLAHLQHAERELWKWFASHRVRKEQADAVRLDLLKTTYRIERDTAPRLYELAARASERLEVQAPLTLYQSQNGQVANASLAFIPDEIHIVLHGPIADALSDGELEALFGHELSHWLLWTRWEGSFLVVDQLLAALANDPASSTAASESARLLRLYTEIFCDRGALAAGGSLSTVVATLVKTQTGLREVHPENYLRQADEIFTRDATRTDGLTHPESFIRARALRLWSEGGMSAEDEIRRMIEGSLSLGSLDLLQQSMVAGLTRRLIHLCLAPAWMQTEVTIGHARLYFEDFQPATEGGLRGEGTVQPKPPGRAMPVSPETGSGSPDASKSCPTPPIDEPREEAALATAFRTADARLRDYFCYVLLDFATTDRNLEEAPLAAAFRLAGRLELTEPFEAIARKELDLRKKQWEAVRNDAETIIARAAAEGTQAERSHRKDD